MSKAPAETPSAELRAAAAQAALEAGINVPPALDIVQLNPDDKLGCWKIKKKLGEGGFGAVYLVKDLSGQFGSGEYAMKAEKATEITRVLKMEVFVLTELKRANAKHFCDLIDRGHIGKYNYIVMTLVGSSFNELRKTYGDKEKQKLSLGCVLSIGIKCVEAIEELHNVGYLHRDIKPGNFSVGKEDPRKVILFDFGMARKYVDAQGRQRTPRWATGFRGTVRYAPLSCHLSRELSRKDDLETWLYTQIELTNGNLPWKSIDNREEVGRYKEKSRTTAIKELMGGCPKEYVEIMLYVDSLRYFDVPKYQVVRDLLKTALTVNNLQEYPYDWEK